MIARGKVWPDTATNQNKSCRHSGKALRAINPAGGAYAFRHGLKAAQGTAYRGGATV